MTGTASQGQGAPTGHDVPTGYGAPLMAGSAWHRRLDAGGPILEVDGLTISTTGPRPRTIVEDVDLTLHHSEILALVGESGSGKTTVALAVMGHLRDGLAHAGGSVRLHPSTSLEPVEMLSLTREQARPFRGSRVAYIPQDPARSLNPGIRVGEQIAEVLRVHGYGADAAEREDRLKAVLREVGLPDTQEYRDRWPHQLSGGQQQRIGIAMAFAMMPDVLILDEPTTGLDVTTQALVLDTVRDLVTRYRTAGLYITHDLAVVKEIADRVSVMRQGEIVEEGPTADVLERPRHPYARTLIAAVPDLAGRNRIWEFERRRRAGEFGGPADETGPVDLTGVAPAPAAVDDGPVLQVRDLTKSYGDNPVLRGIDLDLRRGECTLLLGESGSGKTTLSRALAGLVPGWEGSVRHRGQELAGSTRARTPEQRRAVQYVFQSPYSSLNPRRTLGQSLAVPLESDRELGAAQRRERVDEALDAVRLGRRFRDRRPGDLSGGERQRAAIARALVSVPDVMICDEITSALDVSVQASIIDLLVRLREERGMSLLFVTHNIALARHVAERVAVLEKGLIVDEGPTDEVLTHPTHAYTKELLAHVPTL